METSPQNMVTAATQEVRFATVMTGGVSLAIWMGGVARELNLLDQASRQREAVASVSADELSPADRLVRGRYFALLDLLDVAVRIDVLSGTSAGGINAALLGTCHATGWDLGWLRDVWLKAGDLEVLLRDPATKDPPSLLQGDGVLLKQLDACLERPGVAIAKDVRATTVHVTTTLLDGETSRFTDSYGTLVPDVNHLGVFRFTERQLCDVEGRHALALAARASASFPAAFEPAFLPYGKPVSVKGKDQGPTERPPVDPYLSITRSHWAADGGILANRPIRPILDSIFARPAHARQVRRVLLYVVPDPGGAPRPEVDPTPEAQVDQPLTMARALLGDAGSALNQSIAAELTAIQQQNDRVDAMRDSRLRLAELAVDLAAASRPDGSGEASPEADAFPTEGAWVDYVRRQGEWQVRPVVRSIMKSLSTMASKDIPERWKAELSVGGTIEEKCCQAASEAVTAHWQRPSPGSTPVDLASLGRSAFDGVKAIVVSLLQLGYAANPTRDRRERLAALGERLHAAYRPADGELAQTMVTPAVVEAAKDETGPTLTDLAASLAVQRAADQDAGASDSVDQPAPAGPEGLAGGWELLQGVVQDLVGELEPIVSETKSAEPPTTATPAATAAVDKLRTYLAYLGEEASRWRSRLVGLYVMDRSILPVGVDVDQKVELVQVSATTRTLLDPGRSTPASKLTGTQFHHFGAFYKASWRANDWMWGRLDGAGWLVHVLLDPRRILTIVDADPTTYPREGRAAAFFERLAEAVGAEDDLTSEEARAALSDLAYLDQACDPPLSIPNVALWLAQTWQRAIVANELPVVAREALATPTKRDQEWAVDVLRRAGQPELAEAASRQAVARVAAGRTARLTRNRLLAEAQEEPTSTVPTATSATSSTELPPLLEETTKSIGALLQSCPVPKEKLGEERGEPLFTKTVAKATAVATAAATAVPKPPPTINTVFRTARTTTLTGYRAADAVGFWPRRLIASGAAIAALGVLLSAQGNTILGLTGVALVLAGLYLFAFGVWSTSPRILGALLAVTLLAVVFALTTSVARRALFGTDDDTKAGWVTEHLVPWMRDRWWALLLVLAIVIIVPAVASYIAKWLAERKLNKRDDRVTA